MNRVIYRARGWHAVWTGYTLRRSLPRDTSAVEASLHALNAAGMLAPNVLAEGQPVGPCPRCGRDTAVARWDDLPTVCTGCRADWMSDRRG